MTGEDTCKDLIPGLHKPFVNQAQTPVKMIKHWSGLQPLLKNNYLVAPK